MSSNLNSSFDNKHDRDGDDYADFDFGDDDDDDDGDSRDVYCGATPGARAWGYWAAIKASYPFGGHVVFVLGPGEEWPYLRLVRTMHLGGSTYHVSDDRLWLADGPDVPPAPMRPFPRALSELTLESWLRELARGAAAWRLGGRELPYFPPSPFSHYFFQDIVFLMVTRKKTSVLVVTFKFKAAVSRLGRLV